jgi:hypothetical protein
MLFLMQLAEAFSSSGKELEAWHRLATDPFVPGLVRKKVVSKVLAGTVSDITLRLLGKLYSGGDTVWKPPLLVAVSYK